MQKHSIKFAKNIDETILEEDLSMYIKDVAVVKTDSERDIPELGRHWAITFSHHRGPYDEDLNVANLQVNNNGSQGVGSFAWTHAGFEGRGPLSSQFALSLRGSEFSSFISHDSSTDSIKTALEFSTKDDPGGDSTRGNLPTL